MNFINNRDFIIKILSDIQIKQICQRLLIKLVACCGKDELNGLPATRGCYIINLADRNSDSGGTHWVALYIHKNSAIYYDSYGQPCPLDVYNFISRFPEINFITNEIQLQTLSSVVCGYWAIYFLYYMTNTPIQNPHINLMNFNKLFNIYRLQNNEHKLFVEMKKILS